MSDDIAGLLATLTPDPAKVEVYKGDTFVLETLDQLDQLGLDAGRLARGHSLLLLKPDAVLARAVAPTLEWLVDNGYRVVHAHSMPADRLLARALWYYSWNIASPERRRLADLLVGLCDVLVLVVADEAPVAGPPLAVRLAAAKGPTDPRRRRPGELRHLLGRHSYLLNLVHTPDDPADVLRELAVLFDEPARAAVFDAVAAGRDARRDALVAADRIYAAAPARSFDRDVALDRLLADIHRAGQAVPAGFDRSDTACARLLADAWRAGLELDAWSAIVVGSYVLPMRVGTGGQWLRSVSVADWLEVLP